MRAVCLLDTSIFVEILNLPRKAVQHDEIMASLRRKIGDDEQLFLPMATILETGNHIGQVKDGHRRRCCAITFVQQVNAALNGDSPFKPVSFLEARQLQAWLDEFPDHASQGSGLGDLSIIHDWQRLCEQNTGRRVYIWSLDEHLAGFDRAGTI